MPDDSAQVTGLAGIDTSVAHPARVYDYWLGGTADFPARDWSREFVAGCRALASGYFADAVNAVAATEL